MKWISVYNKLPEEGQMVLVCDREEIHPAVFNKACAGCGQEDGFSYICDQWSLQKHWHLKSQVYKFSHPSTHWMPMPERPRVEEAYEVHVQTTVYL